MTSLLRFLPWVRSRGKKARTGISIWRDQTPMRIQSKLLVTGAMLNYNILLLTSTVLHFTTTPEGDRGDRKLHCFWLNHLFLLPTYLLKEKWHVPYWTFMEINCFSFPHGFILLSLEILAGIQYYLIGQLQLCFFYLYLMTKGKKHVVVYTRKLTKHLQLSTLYYGIYYNI